ncbi:aromatic acid exporter family protein [Bacillus shivajii]|uniref:FUSC family protein n=1 Tax=Bacillus shivajii TaxID=1983719 RepID=UPI001CF95CAB|nr:aromatic acid exporter family protein [Bacillus shivajii]UCZ54112.1 aromatic acid exporter family protein [Bacillus shivajii]
MRLGARIFKTGLAVTLALYAAIWLGYDTPAFAGLGAFFAVQPSVHKSITLIWDQVQANIISAGLAIIFVLAFGHEPFVIGVVVLLVIAIHLKLNKEAIIPLAVVTAIIIMGNPTDEFIPFALNRFLLIMIGVVSAFIVNMIFLPPKHENLLYHKVTNINEQIIQWIRLLIRHDAEYQTLKKDIDTIRENMLKVDNIFALYKDERNLFRKNEYARMRKVVLFRQMIHCTKKAKEILGSLSKHENVLNQLPEEMEEVLITQLDYLTNYHERILLKYAGKVKPHSTDELYEEVGLGKRQLTEVFMQYYETPEIDRNEWIHFFPVIALIIEYSEELEHLDRLMDGFYTFHQDENEVDISEKEF